jgi:hypothetical protein
MNTIFNRHAGRTLAALAAFGLAGTAAHAQTAFTPGNLVISVIGDGSTKLSSAAAATSLEEITTSGTLVQTLSTGLVDSGSATSDGFLTLSSNGQYLTLPGYKGSVGDPSVVASSDPRGIGEVGANGIVTTSFFGDSTYTGNNIRSTASVDGTTIYTGGTASGTNGGVRVTSYAPGSTSATSTLAETGSTNDRVVNIFDGNLYYSTGSGTAGIYSLGAVGTQIAATTGTLIATDAAKSPYDFYFANAATLFVADDSSAGGLQEYTNSGSGFNLANTFNRQGGLRSLAGNGTDIFGVTTAGNGSVVDFNIASGTFSTLYTDTTVNTVIRGVDFAPVAAGAGSPVPEASTTVSFGLLLALGLGGFAVAKKRTARA